MSIRIALRSTRRVTLSMGLLLIAILALSCLSASILRQQNVVIAQQYIQTIKSRNLLIDLGNGVKTSAQLTFPATGKGPFPGVLLIPGSGASRIEQSLHGIEKYLSERGFATLRYDKRGIGPNSTILDKNVWRNMTFNDLKQDAEKALNVLIQQPEVDPKRISLIGHSEGTIIVPRVAVDNPTKVKNIILVGAVAQNFRDLIYFQYVYLPILYAEKVLDHNHNGSISTREASKDPTFLAITSTPLSPTTAKLLLTGKVITTTQFLQSVSNISKNRTTQQLQGAGNSTNKQNYMSIDKELKPLLVKQRIDSLTAENPNCLDTEGCPKYIKSHFALGSTLSMIGNVSSTTGILILQGENDTQTPVQQALLLQQRLTEVNHPDHTLITYPGLGHRLSPVSGYFPGSAMYGLQKAGPTSEYVLADIYAWLEAHSGLSHSFVTTAATNHLAANMTSSSTNTTSNSTSSGKR